MLDLDKDYFIVKDTLAKRPYLAWKENDKFFSMGCFGPFNMSDDDRRQILDFSPIILPNKHNMNNWVKCVDELPEVVDNYSPSNDVLVYDSKRNKICECCWDPMKMEWIDSESMGGYEPHRFLPDYWHPLEIIKG